MQGEESLTSPADVGLFGKHPAFGDFIGRGVPPALQAALEAWLTARLGEVRRLRGPSFDALFDHAAPLGFWIGGMVLPESEHLPLRGVMVGSRDRVGRRYPLVLVQRLASQLPPPLQADDGFLPQAGAALQRLLEEEDRVTAGDLLDCLPPLPPANGQPESPSGLIWATNPDLPAAQLWQGLAASDLQQAAQRRSYWSIDPRPGYSAALALACDGLPEAAVFDWLLAGVAAPAPSTEAAGASDPVTEQISDPSSPQVASDDP